MAEITYRKNTGESISVAPVSASCADSFYSARIRRGIMMRVTARHAAAKASVTILQVRAVQKAESTPEA